MKNKKDYLKKAGLLNKSSSKVADPLFLESAFFDPDDLVQVKYEMVRRVSHEGKSVTETTADFGFSRPSFYEAKATLKKEGLPGLIPKKKGPRRAHKLDEKIMDYVMKQVKNGLKPVELSEAVEKKFKITIHPRSIERAIAKLKKNQNAKTSSDKPKKG